MEAQIVPRSAPVVSAVVVYGVTGELCMTDDPQTSSDTGVTAIIHQPPEP